MLTLPGQPLFAAVEIPQYKNKTPVKLDRFASERETAGTRISTLKSVAMVLSKKIMDCLLQVWSESLPEVKEFKYLGVFK